VLPVTEKSLGLTSDGWFTICCAWEEDMPSKANLEQMFGDGEDDSTVAGNTSISAAQGL